MRADLLHVVGVYSNPCRYLSRARLLKEWMQRQLDSGVNLTVVEHAFGERPFELDQAQWPHVNLVQLRGGHDCADWAGYEIWLKEAMTNQGFASIFRRWPGARYLAWSDADTQHLRADWAAETVHMLQHHRVGQTWTNSVDLDPKGNIVPDEASRQVDRSFSAAWVAGDVEMPECAADYGQTISRAMLGNKGQRDPREHWGYSWAIRADALHGIQRLMDWVVTGAADYYMAHAFAGKLNALVDQYELPGNPTPPTPGFARRLREFARLCDQSIKQDIGVVPGTVAHHWHGKKRERYYLDRREIITESRFDPDVDIAYDLNGLPHLVGDNRLLRDGSRRYNRQRNEDSVDLW